MSPRPPGAVLERLEDAEQAVYGDQAKVEDGAGGADQGHQGEALPRR